MNMIAAITGGTIVQAVVWLLIAAVIYVVLDWAIKKMALGEPITKVLTILLVVLVVVIVLNALFLIAGHPLISW